MSDFDEKAIIRHIHGATVVHKSPFSSVEVPVADDALSIEECEKFVSPFYQVSFRSVDSQFIGSLKSIYEEITPARIELMLAEYDWRPRLTGAFFAALKRFAAFEDQIGRLLVRSDLCFAGKLYCVALAEFNSPAGHNYLKSYLDYYLTRPDLDFDQGDAMGAVAYLDAKNRTNTLQNFRPLWNKYAAEKTWKPDLEAAVVRFAEEMEAVHDLRKTVEADIQ